jgi:LacI family transcriptional regulator
VRNIKRVTAHVCGEDWKLRITIKKIAQELGISHTTVSRVLNEKHHNMVSDSTREQIMQAASRMGYRPNRIAQALQGKSSQIVGVFVPDTDDFFFQEVIKGLRRTLEESGYDLMIFASGPNQITAKWHRLLQWNLDGVFVFDYMFMVDGLWEALTEHTGAIPPVVGLFSNQTQLKDYATIDFAPAVVGLLDHWLARGCRRFGYMALPSSFHPSEQRYAVFSDFVESHRLAQSDIPLLRRGGTLMEDAYLSLSAWMAEGGSLPDALFCQNDEIALGAYRALREAGVAIPSEIALAGCDDLPYVSYLEIPLTSLSLPVQEVCRQGWRILQQRIDDPDSPPQRVVLDVVLKVRASSQKQASVALVSGA